MITDLAGNTPVTRSARALFSCLIVVLVTAPARAQDTRSLPPIRSASSGSWSLPSTWEGAKVPGAGARVLIRPGHQITYDVSSDQPIRVVHVAGTLTFARDRNTRLTVGLLRIQANEEVSEDGFECDAHVPAADPSKPRPALEVGSADQPVDAQHSAVIRLAYLDGMDRQSLPAIVCCGGRMDFHGAPLSRTWVKLGAPASAGDVVVTLAEPVTGWKAGDRFIVTATTRQIKSKKTFRPSVRDNTQTEERIVRAVDGVKVTLDQPLKFDHLGSGSYRAEAANLSRNVIVESADPSKARGHTMYHRGSAGSIGYAEFRHLGIPNVLGRYSLHYHLAGDTMRGSSVIGASIWDSGNRWLTIHGTNYLVVRDCVGYQSLGHGFFFEDGTEVFNLLDRNLAVQALTGKPLPKQVVPFDKNDGAGFWWANSLNGFTRNVACDCDEYGFFFQAAQTADFDPRLYVQQPDGSRKKVDIRTLPFLRFEDNVAHCQRRHAFNLGGGAPFGPPNVGGVGPDAHHPFVIKNMSVWNVHWAFHPVAPSVMVDGMDIHNAEYAIWRPVYNAHTYRNVRLDKITVTPEFAATGTKPRAEDFPGPLEPVDDLPPVTVITHVHRSADGTVRVRGTTSDNGQIKRVVVNGREARPLTANFGEWEIVVRMDGNGPMRLTAHAEDVAGNIERRAHEMLVNR